jgi:hypothetical protein
MVTPPVFGMSHLIFPAPVDNRPFDYKELEELP